MSWFSARVPRRDGSRCAILVGTCVSALFCLIIPAQTFLSCGAELECPLAAFVLWHVGATVLASVALTVVLGVSERYCGRILHVVLLLLATGAFLESGILSAGLAELNGDLSAYESVTRAVVDGCILLGLCLAAIVFYRTIRDWVGWIAGAVLLLAAASLFDVRATKPIAEEPVAGGLVTRGQLVSRDEVVRNARYSSRDNVIVLIVDSVSWEAAQDAFKADPGLAGAFPGFRNYVNNVGMHFPTSVGVPGIFTGDYFSGSADLPRYAHSSYSRSSFIEPYVEAGLPVFLTPRDQGKGWMNVPSRSERARPTDAWAKWHVQGFFPWTIWELSAFRIMPYALKRPYTVHLIHKYDRRKRMRDLQDIDDADAFLWPVIAELPADPQAACALNVHQSLGGHPPYRFDAEGRPVPPQKNCYQSYFNQCLGCFRMLARYMERLQARGLYDCSTILIVGDHSAWRLSREGVVATLSGLRGLPTEAIPLLMVKAKGDRAPYRERTEPTSLARIAPLVRRLCRETLSADQIEAALTQEVRLFREIADNTVSDWRVSRTGEVALETRPDVAKADSELSPLDDGREYRFRLGQAENYPDFNVRGPADRTGGPGLDIVPGADSTIVFRLPDEGPYSVALEATTFRGEPGGTARVFIADRLVREVVATHTLEPVAIPVDGVGGRAGGILPIRIDLSEATFGVSLVSLRVNRTR